MFGRRNGFGRRMMQSETNENGFGRGMGQGRGFGRKNGNGFGQGQMRGQNGMRLRRRDGSCMRGNS